MSNYRAVIGSAQHGQKIDKAILLSGVSLSRRAIRRLLDNGCIQVNCRVERFASRVVYTGDDILIKQAIDQPVKQEKPRAVEPFILYQDQDTLVINKPPHLLSQGLFSKESIDAKTFVLDYLKSKQLALPASLILCHRLDKETSGALLFAKNKKAAAYYMSLFKQKKIMKVYEAICCGKPLKIEWTQTNHLSDIHPKTQQVHVVKSGGKKAITRFKMLQYDSTSNLSYILCIPLTGRSHQLRVQLHSSKLAILGDKKYRMNERLSPSLKNKNLSHHLLHAKHLMFRPFTKKETIKVTAAYPLLFSTLRRVFCY